MPLSGSQHQQVQDALTAAFGGEDALRQMLRLQMDVNLELAAKPGNFAQRTYDVVTWADEHGRVGELVQAALRQNPQNAELLALAEAVGAWHVESPVPAATAPYKGLEFYDVADAASFFGRETLAGELAAHLKDHRFLAVVGASGSGKSSVVRAGVIPALRQGQVVKGSERWSVHVVTPTARPLLALAAELTQDSESVTAQATLMDDMAKEPRSLDLFASRLIARTDAPRLLLVVDQFEELFTLCNDGAEQNAYINNLLAAAVADGVTSVVITLRADFYARCAQFGGLRAALQNHQKYIGPMARNELRTAIEEPALQKGWSFEPGLVDVILDDVASEAGALPLLSHALLETWKLRSGRTMTFGGYHATGGVQGAIARTAEAVYADLLPAQQTIARNVFLRLTTLGEGVQDTRRRVALGELLGSGEQAEQVQAVLKRLADDRLITTEQVLAPSATSPDRLEAVYVDVTHEALIREWPRLGEWLSEDREGLLVHRRLTDAAQEWEDLQRDEGVLLRGARLAQAEEWAKTHGASLNDLEREFLRASHKQAARSRNLVRGLAAAVIGLLLVALLIGGVALNMTQQRLVEAQERADLAAEAEQQRMLAVSAKATAEANLALAQQKLDELAVAALLASGRAKRDQLDTTGAVADFNAAAAAAAKRGQVLDVGGEISDTLRYVATIYVQAGEQILCTAIYHRPSDCAAPDQSSGQSSGQPPVSTSTGRASTGSLANVAIEPAYLTWATAAAPQLVAWSSYTTTLQQQAIISATAFYSQAMALRPPPDTPIYVWIAPGAFLMGSTPEQVAFAQKVCNPSTGRCDTDTFDDEQPAHTVTLGGYWLQRTEVTNAQYARCVQAGGCPDAPHNPFWQMPRSARLPVTSVNWRQAHDYAAWVGGRLPTEAEWEKGCRGSDGRIYPWGNDAPKSALLNYDSEVGGPTEAGTYPPGANDSVDMAGNVWEWTAEIYSADYYKESSQTVDPVAPIGIAAPPTMRGGSWYYVNEDVRCAARLSYSGADWGYDIGFRVVSPSTTAELTTIHMLGGNEQN